MGLPLERIEGKYEILAKLREGGMGAIYKVRHRLLDEIRIVKVLRPQFEGDRDLEVRFAREARAAIRLRHPNVVQIFDFSVDEGGVGFIVMEYIRGADFQGLIDRGVCPSIPLSLEMARQSLRAIAYLHRQGFLHRDVSPDNLMLTLDVDDRPLVKVIDLGIAKQRDSDQGLTQSGMFLGKFRYSSPEHFGAEGAQGVKEASDLYSFGIVIHELLTGAYPIRGKGNSQLIAGHLFHPPRPFDETDPTGRVPVPVRRMIEKALAKDLESRWSTAEEMNEEIFELQKSYPLDRRAVAEARALVEHREETGSSVPVGSTQQRLDEGFGLGTTPIPKVPVDAIPDEATPAPESTFEGFLESGCRHSEEGRFAEAVRDLEQALGLQPENPAVRLLLSEARSRFEDAAGAGAGLGSAVGRTLERPPEEPPPRVPSGLPGDTEPLPVPTPDPERVEALLADAQVVVSKGRFEEGDELLEEARKAALDVQTLHSRIGQVETALRLARRRHEALTDLESRVRSLIADSKLLAADRELFQAEESLGSDEQIESLREELAAAHHREAEEHARERLEVARALDEARRSPEALDALQKALALLPPTSEMRPELEALEARIVQEEDRRELLASTRDRVEALLTRQEITRARGVVDSVRHVLPTGPELRHLGDAIETAVQAQFADLIHLSEVSLGEERFELGLRYLRLARELRPEDPGLAARIVQAEEDKKRRDENVAGRRQHEAELEAIAALIEADLLDQATQRLREEVERWGRSAEAEQLEERLELHRSSVVERVDGLLHRAREAFLQNQTNEALVLMQKVLRLDPHHEEARELVRRWGRQV